MNHIIDEEATNRCGSILRNIDEVEFEAFYTYHFRKNELSVSLTLSVDL